MNLTSFVSYRTKFFIIIILFFLIEYLFLKQTPFFWDAVSKSYRANWFFNDNFNQLVLPTALNTGHPPLWPLMLSVWWKIFGMTLVSSRFLLLIINILVGFQIITLIDKTIGLRFKYSLIIVLIVFLEPTLIAQTTILNNDMLMLLFTILAFNIIAFSNENKQLLLTIALIGLLFANLRGMLIFIGLIIIQRLFSFYELDISNKKNNIYPYVISSIIFVIFLTYQYSILGWIIKSPTSIAHRSLVGFELIIKNIFSIVRNMMDYGRAVIMVLTVILAFRYLKKYKLSDHIIISKLIISFLVFSIGLSIFFMFFSNPIGHRYYLISYILVVILFLMLINVFYNFRYQKYFWSLILVSFISGHFWIYPSTISQGWDSSLIYLNYFEGRDNIVRYIEKNNINKADVGTNLGLNNIVYSDLKNIEVELVPYADLDLRKNKYVILSNIENSTDNEDIITLKNEWVLLQNFERFGVYVSLYKNPVK